MHPIPDGYQTLNPYLVVPEAESMVRFLQEGFGARLLERYNRPDGTLQHSVFQFGGSRLLMGQASEQYAAMRLNTLAYVGDVDAVFAQAVAAGAKVLLPLSNQPYGDRLCGLEDPAGNVWWVATHLEDGSPEKTAGV